jgi:hypothetical protein
MQTLKILTEIQIGVLLVVVILSFVPSVRRSRAENIIDLTVVTLAVVFILITIVIGARILLAT